MKLGNKSLEVKDTTGKETNKEETRAQTQEILSAISSEIPMMIKNILALVFSEDSGRTLGKAAAAYFNELKKGGIPEDVAVRLTENYMRAFTSLADLALPEKVRGMKREQPPEAKDDNLTKRLSTRAKKHLAKSEK